MKYIAVVRGQLKATSQQEAQQVHDAILEKLPAIFEPMGSIGHQAYLDPQNPKAFLAMAKSWNSPIPPVGSGRFGSRTAR